MEAYSVAVSSTVAFLIQQCAHHYSCEA